MTPMTRHALLGLVLAGIVAVPAVAAADVAVNVNIGPPAPPPVLLAAPPALVVVPGVPVVRYTPAVHVDLFFTGGRWYHWHGGHWFVGPSYRGPWTYMIVERVPRVLLTVPAKYYKIPPGHARHGGPPPGHGKGKGKGRGHD